jgi:mannose-6-phosphate isomerase-like protein (cupin superfamily)
METLARIEQEAAATWFAELAGALARGETRVQPVMVERSAPLGAMAPLHRRDEDETYRILEGEITFYVGGDVVCARQGDIVVAPAGVAHTFRADSADARWLVLTRVSSLERFLDFGRAVSPPLAAPESGWPSPSEAAAVAALAEPNGIELLGPPGALPASVG